MTFGKDFEMMITFSAGEAAEREVFSFPAGGVMNRGRLSQEIWMNL